MLRAAALVIGLYGLLRMAWLAHPLLLAGFLGILFGLAVGRGADFLTRFRIPRGLASALVVLAFYGVLFGIGAFAAPTLREQFQELRTLLPQATARIDRWWEEQKGGALGQLLAPGEASGAARPAPSTPAESSPPGGATTGTGDAAAPPSVAQREDLGPGQARTGAAEEGGQGSPFELRDTISGQLGTIGSHLFSFLSSTVAVIAGLLLITFVALYVGADPGTYRGGLIHLIPHRHRPRAAEVLSAIARMLRRWLLSQLIAMVVIGVVTTVVLALLGVEAALSLGLIAGLLEFIPNIGPLLSAVPAVAVGFLDSPQKALMVAVAYGLIQLAENQILIPVLMKQGVDLPPVLTILGQAVMAVVFGFLGLLVAVPLIATVMVAVKMLYVEDVVGDEAGPAEVSG